MRCTSTAAGGLAARLRDGEAPSEPLAPHLTHFPIGKKASRRPSDGSRRLTPTLCVWCDSAKVLRCQLPRRNAYLAFDPDVEDEEGKGTQSQGGEKGVKRCHVCGLRADKLCSACRGVSYCSRVHQKEDWRAGHKHQCQG